MRGFWLATMAFACSPVKGIPLIDAEVVNVESLAISPGSAMTLKLGLVDNVQLTATATLSTSGVTDVSSTAMWSSSDDTVASVSGEGLVTPLAVGTTSIAASLGGQMASEMVVVAKPTMVVASFGNGNLTAGLDFFDPDASGNSAPEWSIRGSATTLVEARGVVFYKGELFVPEQSGAAIDVFPADGSGDIAPTRRITGSATGFGVSVIPIAIAVDNDKLYVTTGAGVVSFNTTDDGDVAPLTNLTGSATTFQSASGVFAANGELYVSDSTTNSITVFPESATGSVAPTRAIVGSATDLQFAFAVYASPSGEVYVANPLAPTVGRIAVFAPMANGNVAPVRELQGANSGLDQPVGVRVLSNRLYTTNLAGNAVNAYDANSSGEIPATSVLAGSATLFSQPIAIDFF